MRALNVPNLLAMLLGAILAVPSSGALAQDADELAKKLANPVASMVSLPFQFNYDYGAGPSANGQSYLSKVQPVIPFVLNEDWNVVSRTILPTTFATNIFPTEKFGVGDIAQSFFFTPSAPSNFIWAVGPAFSLPTATDASFGSGKLGIGPTALVLLQMDKLGIGALITQTWSVLGDPNRPDVNVTALQPFVNYSLGEGQTLGANLEASYDWNNNQWSVPLNLTYSKVFKVGDQAMSAMVGYRKYLVTAPGGPDWGLRAGLTFMFPQ